MQNQINLKTQYFKIGENDLIYATMEAKLSRVEYEQLTGSKEEIKVSNKRKYLMLYNDESGSMHGNPFNAMIKANRDLADLIFSKDGNKENHMFETVHLIYHGDNIDTFKTDSKEEYVKIVDSRRLNGNENFVQCFNHII
jgi:hypothetical protein